MMLGDDFTTCYRAACELNDINKERQDIERGVLEDAMKQVEENSYDSDPCVVVFDPRWHPGVVGIIAGKLSREFHRPVIVFGEEDGGFVKGSGRSIHGIDLVECLVPCADMLGSWGGHPMAVGVSVKSGGIDEFRRRINAVIIEKYGKDIDFSPKININLTLDLSDVGIELLDELELLHPFGEGNREPIFALKSVVLPKSPEIFGGGANFRFQIPLSNGWINAVAWRMAGRIPPAGKKIDMAVKLGWNRWNRRKTPQATLVDWKLRTPEIQAEKAAEKHKYCRQKRERYKNSVAHILSFSLCKQIRRGGIHRPRRSFYWITFFCGTPQNSTLPPPVSPPSSRVRELQPQMRRS